MNLRIIFKCSCIKGKVFLELRDYYQTFIIRASLRLEKDR